MIHLIIGRQGAGKTLYLVMKAYEYYKLGYDIYSNVSLNFPYKQLDYNDIVECNLNNAIVILDEIHLLLPARNSISRTSREICDGFLSMVRKKGLEVFGTTQTMRKVDVRFREEADYIYDSTKYAYLGNQWVEVLHNQNLKKSIPIMIKLNVTETSSLKTRSFSFKGNDLFDKYNTKEIIKVKGIR